MKDVISVSNRLSAVARVSVKQMYRKHNINFKDIIFISWRNSERTECFIKVDEQMENSSWFLTKRLLENTNHQRNNLFDWTYNTVLLSSSQYLLVAMNTDCHYPEGEPYYFYPSLILVYQGIFPNLGVGSVMAWTLS